MSWFEKARHIQGKDVIKDVMEKKESIPSGMELVDFGNLEGHVPLPIPTVNAIPAPLPEQPHFFPQAPGVVRNRNPFDFTDFKVPSSIEGMVFPVKFDLVTVEKGREFDKDSIIYLYVREQVLPYRKFKIKVIDFLPWFGVNQDSPVQIGGEVLKVEDGYTSLDSTPTKRIYTAHVSAVPELRENYPMHYEADVLYHNRFKIEKGIKSGIILHRYSESGEYLCQDIEGF